MSAPLLSGEPDAIEWRYTFCDLRTRTRLARLPLVGADLSEVIGAPADGSGTVPISDDDIRARDPWTATTPRRTVVFAQRIIRRGGRVVAADPQPTWAGVVWKRVRSGRDLKLSLSTIESYYARRLIARDRVFAWQDDALILATLFADADAVATGSLGLAYDATTLGTYSDRTVLAADLKTVLETAQSVASAGGGFDWRLTPVGSQAAGFGWRLDRSARMGRTDARQLTWTSHPDGRPGNELVGYELAEDGSAVPNEVTGLGTGTPPDQLRSVATAAQIGSTEVADGYPLLQSALAASSTNDLSTQAAVDRHTAAELTALRAAEVQVSGMTVRGDRGPTLDTYGLGDVVLLKLRDPLHRVPLTYSARIVGRRILPGEPGRNETVAMTLQPIA